MNNKVGSIEQLKKAIVELVVAAWRFRRVFEKAMTKIDLGESNRYARQLRWFLKEADSALEEAGLRIVNVEGQAFDVGMAVTPLNMEDFSIEDKLFVEQMLEPIIMEGEVVLKTGTVILRRVAQ